jgi:integrase/recombinase XerC
MERDSFISYIQFEKRYSPHTVNAYRNDIDQFYDFSDKKYGIVNIGDVNHMIIRSWIIDLIEHGLSARSVNRKLTSLKSFYKFLNSKGILEQDPMQRIISPKTSKRLPVFIEKEKMDTLFMDIDFGTGFQGARNRLILEMLYDTGMRLSELINLKVKDIDFHHSTLKVLGKRNKERLIPFSDKFASQLKKYLQERSLFLEKTEDFVHSVNDSLFFTNTCRDLYPKFVYRIVTAYLGEITTLSKKSPHVLRHTFATHLLNNGAELNAVKELLGHASLAATQVYTHNTIGKLKKIYHQAHPKA